MVTIMKKFLKTRRSATGMIFALCLLPLVLMIGLAIDFTFFTEARSQIQIAADAAATHAVRAATGTYALETSQGVSVSTAQADAKIAGNLAGQKWFTAQLGQLPTASVPTTPSVDTEVTTAGAGFTATVNYAGIYPPFFDRIFASTANWNIIGKSNASAQYNYVEILMMLDTSQSMLIGADKADILLMNQNSVCMDPTLVQNPQGDNPMLYGALYGTTSTPQYGAPFNSGGLIYQYLAADGDQVDFSPGNIAHYTNSTGNQYSGGKDDVFGSCKSGYQEPAFSTAVVPANKGGAAVPCAFACHYSATIAKDGLPADLYGQARRDGAKLRLDSVLQATEEVLSSMINGESAANEFAVGLYQFNTDVSALTAGTTGGGTGAGDPNYEATYNIGSVLSKVQSIDYSYAPESKFPPVDIVDDGNTDFPTSMNNFYKGNATNGNPIGAVGANAGKSAGNPLKDLFIVTDGMNDTCTSCTGLRTMGEMTGIAAESGKGLNKAVCQPYKTLGFTVYVLYIKYTPIPHLTYYLPYKTAGYSSPSNPYVNEDFPTLANGAEADYNGSTAANGGNTPDVAALEACASMTGQNLDFYTASDSASIAKAMGDMLQSALGSAIQVTN
jgi:Flp pilus assembly protein TadG